MKKGKKLTLRQKRFLKALPSAKSATEAAILAGYSPKSARETASRLLNKNQLIKEELKKSLKKANITLDNLAKDLRIAISSGLGKRSTNTDSIRAIELAYKLLGAIDKAKDNYSYSYTLQLHSKSTEELKYMLKELRNIKYNK